jgi:hypothetical protein
VKTAHPGNRDRHRIESDQPAPLAYLLVGAAAAAERRTRATVAAGARVAVVAAWPAERVWRSPLGAPIRRRADEASASFTADGRELVRRGRVRARATGTQLARRLGEQLVQSGLADELVDRLLSTGAFDRVVTVVINHPATEALVANALDDPGLDRLITRVMDSRLIDELTARLLESEEMRLVLDYVTRSPELRAALAHQTAGLADDVAAGVRSRTVVADAAAENFARRLIGRRNRPQAE